MTAETVPILPAPEGWTIADIDALPENGLRYELVDGVPRVMNPPRIKHQRALKRLDAAVEAAAPVGMAVWQGIGVVLAPDQRRVPDLVETGRAEPGELLTLTEPFAFTLDPAALLR